MVLFIYNTLKKKKEVFEPLKKKKVKMFVCGPTVYDYSHLGHARTYIAFDIIARYLRFKGYDVFYLQNITDIDDKIIKRAKELGISWKEVAEKFTNAYYEDMKALNIKSVNMYAKATDFIEEIIKQVKGLIEKGYAYVANGSVYYDVLKFKEYGKLSHQSIDEIKAGARVKIRGEKKNPLDFALWKKSEKDEPGWKSPWGIGRPGWHIEDTAITISILGEQYDLHGGARDLIFPHHEAEIAQAEAFTGKKPFVKYWLHTGFLTVNGEKMAKSLKNFITIRDALKKWDSNVIRFFFSSVHYRSQLDYSEKGLEKAKKTYERLVRVMDELNGAIKNAKKGKKLNVKKYREEFIKAMDDDFNLPLAISKLFDFVHYLNIYMRGKPDKESLIEAKKFLLDFSEIIGIELEREFEIPDEIKKLVKKRERLRKEGKFEESDMIRKKIREMGWEVQDTPSGTKVRKRI